MSSSSRQAKEYGNPHRIFLQAMMQRRIVDSTEMYDLFEISMKEGSSETYVHPTETTERNKLFGSFIWRLNTEISKVILKVD